MSQWAEIRHMYLVDGIPKKEIARRFGLNVKTVRRALQREEAPLRRHSPPRGRRLDPFRDQIEAWLRDEPRITAKRVATLLGPRLHPPLSIRAVRKYVAAVRARLHPREAYVHRTQKLGDVVEFDFGDAWVVVGGFPVRVKFLVATLPASNVYFAKVYWVERLECLLDGIVAAFRWFGGVPRRMVLDNTSLAVKQVLGGPDRIECQTFHAFRGAFPIHADYCAPRKAWEKGSVERGVGYVRANCLRPMPRVASLSALNAQVLAELERDLEPRRLPDGRPVRSAFAAERRQLRPLPVHLPDTCRVLSAVANKYGHVRVDRVGYSMPIEYAYRPVLVKLFHDRVVLVVDGTAVAEHRRGFQPGTNVLNPLHVLPLLEKKHRAVPEATALQQWRLPGVFYELRRALHRLTRKPDQEWVSVLRLVETHPLAAVEAAVRDALRRRSPRLETIRLLLRPEQGKPRHYDPAPVTRADLAEITVRPPTLGAYDALTEAF